MIPYQVINRDSGVLAYATGTDYIDVKFKGTSKVYRYSYQKAGKENVETMKALAQSGDGLNSFINKNVKYLYD